MCGIAGIWDPRRSVEGRSLEADARSMARSLAMRGPDGNGVWTDDRMGVGLAHARLAVIDLSSSAAQPMASRDGRLVLVYNGELYNAPELRSRLAGQGITFRGASDTEVLLELCAAEGVAAAVSRLNGMYAFAVFDRKDRTLYLARDPIGIKPLYWAYDGRSALFGSELKALHASGRLSARLDASSAASYFRLGYVPGPYSIFDGVRKVEPGTLVTLRDGEQEHIETFWSFRDAALSAQASRLNLADADAIDGLEQVLQDSVARQLVADVPVGVLLSGGVDSSIIAALAQRHADRQIKSFSIGFRAQGFDEAPYASAVAAHLGLDHTELYVDVQAACDVIPQLPDIYDEPFADSSQIPTHLVSVLARKQVTVVLSGDGGDELFGGYDRYAHALRLGRHLERAPAVLRRAIGAGLGLAPRGVLDRFSELMPKKVRIRRLGSRARKVAAILRGDVTSGLYRSIMSHFEADESPVKLGREHEIVAWTWAADAALHDRAERLQLIDAVTYLPDDILTKVDRASMAVSLEARVPLLDARVVEYALRLSPGQKRRDGVSKWILREVLYRHVPKALVDRPKMGFGVPLGAWLRGPLRDWASDLLSPQALAADGLLRPEAIVRMWNSHLSGQSDWSYPLWTALSFQAWRRRWRF